MHLPIQRTPILAIALLASLAGGCHRKASDNTPPVDNAAQATASSEGGADPAEVSERQPLSLSTDGLLLIDRDSGEARQLLFGTEQFPATQQVNNAIGNFTGQAEKADCGAGPLTAFDYPGGITLYFQDRKFVGWDFGGPGKYQTPNGIGIGSSLEDLRGAGQIGMHDSPVGHEFSAGDLHGLVDATTPAGKVINLWAGTTCNTR
jgi:hypothetical protein